MIIKSMARKQPSFGQLIDYFGQKSRNTDIFSRNLYADALDSDAVEREFLNNFSYLPKRKNGNSLYHEVIALAPDAPVSSKRQDEILLDLAERYCEQRASDQLVYGRLHDDLEHRHIHLMISANAVRSDKRVRVPKEHFAQIQRDMEDYLLEHYPELGAARVYTHSQEDVRVMDDEELESRKVAMREGELERRSGKPSKKRQIKMALEEVLKRSSSYEDLNRRLEQVGFKLYQRGSHVGVDPIDEGRRFRLKTLGLELELRRAVERFEQRLSRRDELLQVREAGRTVEDEERTVTQDREESSRSDVSNSPGSSISDDRAAELLRNRQGLERFAEDHLRDSEEGREC